MNTRCCNLTLWIQCWLSLSYTLIAKYVKTLFPMPELLGLSYSKSRYIFITLGEFAFYSFNLSEIIHVDLIAFAWYSQFPIARQIKERMPYHFYWTVTIYKRVAMIKKQKVLVKCLAPSLNSSGWQHRIYLRICLLTNEHTNSFPYTWYLIDI